jgi:hypothetical protein
VNLNTDSGNNDESLCETQINVQLKITIKLGWKDENVRHLLDY